MKEEDLQNIIIRAPLTAVHMLSVLCVEILVFCVCGWRWKEGSSSLASSSSVEIDSDVSTPYHTATASRRYPRVSIMALKRVNKVREKVGERAWAE